MKPYALASLLALAALLAAALPAQATYRAATPPFTVSSSLAGKKVLGHRAHWVAVPSLPEEGSARSTS